MNNYKIIRMTTGEDIMAEVEAVKTKSYKLNKPMRLIFRRTPVGQTILMMMPWVPIELIEENSAVIKDREIITTFVPKESMVKYYQMVLRKVVVDIEEGGDLVEKLLQQEEEFENMERGEEISAESLEEFVKFSETKDKIIH